MKTLESRRIRRIREQGELLSLRAEVKALRSQVKALRDAMERMDRFQVRRQA